MAFLPSLRQPRLSRCDRLSWLAVLAMGGIGLWTLDLATNPMPIKAQSVSSLPSCAPPGPDEYLLLVALQTEEAQGKLTNTLPPSVKAPMCNYLGSRVARMGGFQTPADADAWASYLRDTASLPAFVAKPTQSRQVASVPPRPPGIKDPANLPTATQTLPQAQTSPTAKASQGGGTAEATSPAVSPSVPPLEALPPPVMPTQPRLGAKVDISETAPSDSATPIRLTLPKPTTANQAPPRSAAPSPVAPPPVVAQATEVTAPPAAGTSSVTTYTPQLLAEGYVVLVDYGNQTSLAPLVRQLTKRSVGLASYGQRPFLMVNYTADSKAALATLKMLDKSGFRTMLVEAARVTLLTPDVQVK